MLSDLFMCPRGAQTETYELLLDSSPDSAEAREHGWIPTKALDFVVLPMLGGALGDGDSVLEPEPDESGEGLFCELGPGFVKALATADPARLRAAGEVWITTWAADLASIPSFEGELPEGMRPRLDGEDGWWPVLEELATLARRATTKGWSVYLFMTP